MFDDVRMVEKSEYFDLSFDLFEYSLLLDFLLVEDLNSYLVSSDFVEGNCME